MSHPVLNSVILGTALLLTAGGCLRSTCVSGVVTDAVSGLPVQNAHLDLKGFDGYDPQGSANPKLVITEHVHTDSLGRYFAEIAQKGVDRVRLDLEQPDYDYSVFNEIRSGQVALHRCREINITFDSYDGLLRLIFNNESGSASKIYLRVDCDFLKGPGNYYCNPLFEHDIATGESKTIDVRVAANRPVPVIWDTQKFDGWVATHIDSVFCTKGDTTEFTIAF